MIELDQKTVSDLRIDFCKTQADADARINMLSALGNRKGLLVTADGTAIRQFLDAAGTPSGTNIKSFGDGFVVISWSA
ncbi:hypothetical protein C7S18_20450 [Ahniella affigens]|uniref:Uncharacterized protein n=1 Tax=Ahniella affigens TaxID=2021234 RepID=A0A2P1PX35_9GAMM|nr:hypothetical protein [Ahniella affigens]AVP99395.1 hypothetical protein C7S18_20450 [Ahniella affigens]